MKYPIILWTKSSLDLAIIITLEMSFNERQPLLLSVRHIANDFDNLCDDDKLALVLDKGCQHLAINREEHCEDVDWLV